MSLLIAEQPMTRRNDVAVKIDAEVTRIAKIVAAHKDISLAEYLSETLKPIVERDLREYSRRALEAGEKEEGRSKPKRTP
jgi:hypothetical protein